MTSSISFALNEAVASTLIESADAKHFKGRPLKEKYAGDDLCSWLRVELANLMVSLVAEGEVTY